MIVRSVAVNLTANVAAYQAAMARAAASTTAVGTAAAQASARAGAANLAHQRATLQLTQTQARAGRELAAAQNNLAQAQARHLQAVQTGSRAEQAATRQQVALQRQALEQIRSSTNAQLNGARAQQASARQAQLITQQQTLQQQALQQAHARTQATIQGTGLALGAVGAALIGVVAVGVDKAAEFEQAMSHVAAATHAGAAEMGQLRQAALDAGARTVFTAKESAGAIEEMAKAGVRTTDILNGGLNGALSLAAAGTLDVGQAAELASSTMVQFGLKGDQVSHIADVMAASAGKAQGSVQDVGTAMSYVGPVAAQMGISMEETAGAITLLSNNGILAEKAGTGLRGMLLSLTSPSAKAAQEMSNLGINVFGSDGKFIGLAATAQVLHDRLGGLSESARDAALGIIFSNAQMPAAISLMTGGAKAVNGFTAEVNDQGYAAETARLKLDNLRGDVEKLGGALDTAFIQGGSGQLAPLRKVVEGVTGVVNAYGRMPGATQTALVAIAGLTGAVTVAGGAFLLAGPRIVATRAAMASLRTTAPGLTGVLTGLGKAAAGLGTLTIAATAVGALAAANERAAPGVNTMTDALLKLGGGSGSALDSLFKGEEGVNGFTESIKRLADPPLHVRLNNLAARIVTVGQVGDSSLDAAKKQAASLDAALAGLVNDGHADQAAASFNELAKRANAAGISTDKFRALLPQYADAVKGAGNASALTAQDQSALKKATDAASTAMENAKNVIDDLKTALDEMIGVNLSADAANSAFQQSLDDMTQSLKDGAKAAHGHTMSLDANTKAGRDNRAAVRGAVSALIDKLNADAKAGKSANALEADLRSGSSALIDQAHKAGLTRKQVQDLTRTYGLTPKLVETLVRAIGVDTAKSDILAVQHTIDRLTGKTVEIKVSAETLASIRDLTGSSVSAGQAASNIAKNRAAGGYIDGPGGPTDDVIPAWLSNGEYVVRASAVRALGVDFLDSINRYANGGPVTRTAVIREHGPSARERVAVGNVLGSQVDAIARAVGGAVERRLNAITASMSAGAGLVSGGGRAGAVWNALVSRGFSGAQAAGVMGNIAAESGYQPNIVQGGGRSLNPAAAGSRGYGLVQWTPGRKLLPYLHGQAPTVQNEIAALAAQLAGQGPYPEAAAGAALRRANTPSDAANVFGRLYERYAGGRQLGRERTAEQVFAQFGRAGGGASAIAGGGRGSSLGHGLYRPVHGGRLVQGLHDAYTGFPAIDIGVPVGTPVYAGASGRVVKSYDIPGFEPRNAVQNGFKSYGRIIQILSDGFSTLYAHLSRRGVGVGTTVGGGQVIGLSGNTGHSTGPHLHFGAQGTSATRFYAGGGLVRRGFAAGGRVTTTNPRRGIAEDDMPRRSPDGGRLLTFHNGVGSYSDGWQFSAAGWRRVMARVTTTNKRHGLAEDDMPARSPHGGRLVRYSGGVGTYSDGSTYSAAGWKAAPPVWHALPGNVPGLPAANATPAAVDRSINAMDAYVKRWQEANRAADEHTARLGQIHALTQANSDVAKAEAEVRKAARTKDKSDDQQARADLAQARAARAQARSDLAAFDAQARRDARQRALDARQAQLQQARDAAQRRADAAAAAAQTRLDRTNQLAGVDYTSRQLPTPAPSISAVLINARDAVAQIIEWSRDLATLRKRGLSNTAIAALKLEDGPQMLGLERQLLRGTDAEIRQLSSLIWRQRVLSGRSAAGQRLADGGWVSGPGGPREDRVPAWLSAGEFVVNAAAAARFGAQLERINRPRFADGGPVRSPQWSQRIDVAAPPVDTWALQMEMRRTREAVDRQTAALTQRSTVVAVAGGVV